MAAISKPPIFSLASKRVWDVHMQFLRSTRYGSSINLCALDMSKAFDKVNHYALFNKLMDRQVPRVSQSQKSFNRSRDGNSADTAATEFVT